METNENLEKETQNTESQNTNTGDDIFSKGRVLGKGMKEEQVFEEINETIETKETVSQTTDLKETKKKSFRKIIAGMIGIFLFMIIYQLGLEQVQEYKANKIKEQKEQVVREKQKELVESGFYEKEKQCEDYKLTQQREYVMNVIKEGEQGLTDLSCQQSLLLASYEDLQSILYKLKDNGQLHKLQEKEYQDLIKTMQSISKELNLNQKVYGIEQLFLDAQICIDCYKTNTGTTE